MLNRLVKIAEISSILADFLPFLFVTYGIYRLAVRFTLPSYQSLHVQRTFLYLPLFWIGAHMGPLTVSSPLDRLTAADVNARSGALALIVILAILIAGIALYQLNLLRKAHLLPRIVGWYSALGLFIILPANCIPHYSFRVLF